MFAIFNSQSGAIANQIAYSMPEPDGTNDPRIDSIEDNSAGDLSFAEFSEELPDGVYNGDEGF